ncbi:MAG: hypothetical protein Q9M19_03100, partial [Mariprofundaceae bacterium]|nr:hypothetical protein [Mariprofundaceae bacterium]
MVVDHYGLVLGRSLNDGILSDAFLSSTGYYVNIRGSLDPLFNGSPGAPENVHYSDPICTIPAYIDSPKVSSDKVKYGYVFTGKNNSILYIQRDVIPVTKNTLGILFQYNLSGFQTGCYSVATANATGTMIPILANDPAITGVPNSATLPFHIQ